MDLKFGSDALKADRDVVLKAFGNAGWVDFRLGQCKNRVMVNGVLIVRKESGKVGSS